MFTSTTLSRRLTLGLALFALVSFAVAGVAAAQDTPDKQPPPKAASDDAAAQPGGEDPAPRDLAKLLVVPEGDDVAALHQFIKTLMATAPANPAEERLLLEKGYPALEQASERILKLEQDVDAEAFRLARALSLSIQLRGFPQMEAQDREALGERIAAALQEGKELNLPVVGVAMNVVRSLEGNPRGKKLTATLATRFSEIIAKRAGDNPGVAQLAATLGGTARRLNILGSKMEVKGRTLAGEPFDLASLKGKVVLVDFWATWCGPCLAEIPNIKRLYAKYGEHGFEVIGISLDRNRFALEKYVDEEKLPWVILHDPADQGNSPVAAHYGISSIPAMFLVGRDGKVLSDSARGGELARLLAEQFPDVAADSGDKP